MTAQLLLTYAPDMNDIFQTRRLDLADGLLIIGIAVGLLIFPEAEKLLMRRLGWFEELKQ